MAILRVKDASGWHNIPAIVGPPGATPHIQIGTVETLEAGSEATASMGGTAENPLLNLGIPRGANGAGEWELLETIELEEAVESYSKEFPAMREVVLTVAPKLESSLSGWKYFVVNGTGFPAMNSAVGTGTALTVHFNSTLAPFVEVFYGIYSAPAVGGVNGGGSATTHAPIGTMGNGITSVGISTAGLLTKGTSIKIWGKSW